VSRDSKHSARSPREKQALIIFRPRLKTARRLTCFPTKGIAMKIARYGFAALALCGVITLASCSDIDPVAPPAPAASQGPQAELLGDLIGTLGRTLGLLRCTPMPTYSAQRTIGPMGGTINVGPHSLYIPPGALSSNVLIKAKAPSGNINKLTLTPHGLQFNKGVYMTMSYDNCEGLLSRLPKRIAYVDGNLNILEILFSLDNIWDNEVTGRTDHFSDFVLAW
jgi:hypothetical protein